MSVGLIFFTLADSTVSPKFDRTGEKLILSYIVGKFKRKKYGLKEPTCEIFGVPVTYETHIFLWLLVKLQIVEWDCKLILSMILHPHA